MVYSTFIALMNSLERTFGYEGAIRIKDSADYLVGIILGICIALRLMGKFYREVDVDKKLSSDVAIWRAAKDGDTKFLANPHTTSEVVEVFFGYVVLKIFAQESIRFKNLRTITYTMGLITGLLFLIGVLMSLWDYLPMAGH